MTWTPLSRRDLKGKPDRRGSGSSGWQLAAAVVVAFALAQLPHAVFGQQPPRELPPRLSPGGAEQLQRMEQAKRALNPIQRKISTQLMYEILDRRGDPLVAAVPLKRSGVEVTPDGKMLVDIKADVTDDLLRVIEGYGGVIISSHPQYRAIRAQVPYTEMESLAASPEVHSIRPADRATTNKINTTQGDVAHRANQVRATFGVTGAGRRACALSDGVDSLASVQSTGDLPTVTIVPGQQGSGTEGTAMLEIVHDIAPGASLAFATAFNGQASFAQNITDLRFIHGCDVIVDDVTYFAAPFFQDGIIAQAVDAVRAAGALYFSSAGNDGNFNDGTAGVWEGNYSPAPLPPAFAGSGYQSVHTYGGGVIANRITQRPPFAVTLQWTDPMGASSNDYDIYLFDPTGTFIRNGSDNFQTGTQDPIEIFNPNFDIVSSPGTAIPIDPTNHLLVVAKWSGLDRRIMIHTFRGRLQFATPGAVIGHAAAAGAIAVAATNVANAGGGAFGSTSLVETFSSDGPRFIQFNPNGTVIPGGTVRQKPDLTAADGVATATPGFNPFFGTSAAAPHAAGIATLLWSGGGFTNGQIETAMRSTAINIEAPGIDRDSGHGIVDALAAANALGLSSADLHTAWGKLRPTCDPGACAIKGEFFVRNQGAAAAPASTARIYFSTDSAFNPSADASVVTVPIPSLAPGQAQRSKLRVPLPAGVTNPANTFLFAVADDGNTVPENDETNNATPFSFGPTP